MPNPKSNLNSNTPSNRDPTPPPLPPRAPPKCIEKTTPPAHYPTLPRKYDSKKEKDGLWEALKRILLKKYDKAFDGLNVKQKADLVFKDQPFSSIVSVETKSEIEVFGRSSDKSRY
jgi:hypothetical protein